MAVKIALVGQQFPALAGWSTVLPEIDWETYSEAGYVWKIKPGYWKKAPKKPPLDAILDASGQWCWEPPTEQLEGGNKKGLMLVGTYNYVRHPTFGPIQLAYNLKDGQGCHIWRPGMPDPQDLLDWVQSYYDKEGPDDGVMGILESWNNFFEVTVWNEYCAPNLGWPKLCLGQMRDAMAKAAMSGYPRKLENAGEVLRLANKKDPEGAGLIKKLTVPRNPTKANPARRWTRETAPLDFAKFDAYNVGDILAESEASLKIPDLSAVELERWQVDQRINHRGMYIDLKAVDDSIAIIEQAQYKYWAELSRITNGAVTKHDQVAKTIEWLRTQGVYLDALDEDVVEEELAKNHAYTIQRVLKIRQTLSFGSVKKLYGMRNQTCSDGRLRDMFAYAANHTQHWAGVGPQVMNLFKGKFNKPEQVEFALSVLASRSLEYVEAIFSQGLPWDKEDNEPMEALDVIANCLRSMITAAPGHRLIMADYNAIQAVITAALAGEKWQLDVFHTHGKIYETTASELTGKPLQFYLDYRKREGKHHPDRQLYGKIPTLACLAPKTKVLTNRGYVDMVNVQLEDKLWDGVQWVNHGGLIFKGVRPVMVLDGAKMTPNHPVSIGRSWRRADWLVKQNKYLPQALAHGSANLPSSAFNGESEISRGGPIGALQFNVPAVENRIWSRYTAFARGALHGVTRVLNEKLAIAVSKNSILSTPSLSLALNIGEGCSIGYPPQLEDATALQMPRTIITGREGLPFVTNGEKTKEHSWFTSSPSLSGIIRILKWTGRKLTAITNRGISDLFLKRATPLTEEKFLRCNLESQSLSPVYDIVNAGPLHRFTIKTNNGHLLVHNSGFGAYVGGWRRFDDEGILGTDEEVKALIFKTWAKNPNICELWGGQTRNKFGKDRQGRPANEYQQYYGLEGAAIQAILNPGTAYGYRGIRYQVHNDVMYCIPPGGGSPLVYHEPRTAKSTRDYARPWEREITYVGWNTQQSKKGRPGWVRMPFYGGIATQNIVAKVHREFQADTLVALDKTGVYLPVHHAHDENVTEVADGQGSKEEYLSIVNRGKPWAVDDWGRPWPIKAPSADETLRYGRWE